MYVFWQNVDRRYPKKIIKVIKRIYIWYQTFFIKKIKRYLKRDHESSINLNVHDSYKDRYLHSLSGNFGMHNNQVSFYIRWGVVSSIWSKKTINTLRTIESICQLFIPWLAIHNWLYLGFFHNDLATDIIWDYKIFPEAHNKKCMRETIQKKIWRLS